MQRLTFRLTTAFLSSLIYLAVSAFTAMAQDKTSSIPPPTNDEGKWERYKGAAFSVLLPERPTAAITSRPMRVILASEAERYRGILYSAYSDGVVYLIYSFPRHSEPIKQFVDEFAIRHAREQTVVSAHELTTNGVSGQRYLVNFRDVDAVMDVYVTDSRAYILHVIGGDDNNPSIKRFLESFTTVTPPGRDYPTAIEIKPASKNSPPTEDTEDSGPVYTTSEVTRKAVIVLRPNPQYTEAARERRVSGTVILKVVLSSSGKVANIEAKTTLPRGLTEKAMEAARQIKFVPAIKDGKLVSQSIQLEYNFSVY